MSPQKGNTMSQTPQGIKNPIKKDGAFHTPEDWDEMYHYIGQYSGSEKTVAAVVAGMVNNLSHKLVEDLIAGEHLRYNECRHDVLRRLTKHIK